MGSAPGMNQLLKNLCHHTIWKYAILWKFQHDNSMILSCEDSYAIDAKSGSSMEYASYEELISRHPWGSNAQSGNSPDCSITVAVSNMTRNSYMIGEGIIGKVASMENHQWICVEEMDPDLLLECSEELELQVAAGIKTILLLPLLHLGIVQLGSLDKLSEDLLMVAQLMDLFSLYHHTSTSGLRMEQTDSSMTSDWPSLEKYTTGLEINTKLVDPTQCQPLKTPEFTTFNFDQVMVNELLPVHGVDTDLFYEKSWNTMCSELFRDHSEEQLMLNTSTFVGKENDRTSNLHVNDVKPIPVADHKLVSKNTSVFDLCDFNKAHLTFLEEFDLIIDSTTDSKYMDFSVEAGAHNTMEHSYFVGIKDSEWMDNNSKADEGSKFNTIFKEERPKSFDQSDTEPCLVLNENRTDGKELESHYFAKPCCSSTGKCADSCLMPCKAEDVSNSADSGLLRRNLSSLISDSEGFKSHPTTCQLRTSYHLAPKNIDDKDIVNGFWRSGLKESCTSYRQTKYNDPKKPRPRDRQLIQERIRELRELIPNSSKCSVDALLQRTVDHMMFLRSVPVHANKLSKSTRPKVVDKDLSVQSTEVPQPGASSARDLENKSTIFPLIIENLDQPDQMLVEMQCRSYRLFLEIAQAIKRLGLTILKGVLETRSDELWAHFIVEIPKGFHRMDILWPLMQLQQLKM